MTEVQIEASEVVTMLQEMFPLEYTIVVQRVHIRKLEEKLAQPHIPGD